MAWRPIGTGYGGVDCVRQGKAARRIRETGPPRGQSGRGDGAPAFGSTDPRRRQATSLFSRADQTSVIKIRSRKCGKRSTCEEARTASEGAHRESEPPFSASTFGARESGEVFGGAFIKLRLPQQSGPSGLRMPSRRPVGPWRARIRKASAGACRPFSVTGFLSLSINKSES
jgi:hypothetical protein